jgi:hypothetical protein
MTDNDIPEFGSLITSMWAMFGRQPTDAVVDIYWTTLKKYPIEKVRSAVKAACEKATFCPVPAVIIEQIPGRVNHIQSWGQIRSCIRSHGWCSPGKAEAALSRAQWSAIQILGGWSYLCTLDSSDIERIGRTSYKDALDGAERQEEQLADRAQQIADAKADMKRLK